MSSIQRRQLTDGTDVVWAIPLSGMGHVADEQPLPYLHKHGVELTPRFGGEEQYSKSGLTSLPLPYGYLANSWPWRQRIFNLPRRRINIYWRNIFKDATRNDRLFHFLTQLNYFEINNGFQGHSPSVTFQRVFSVSDNSIEVHDSIEFKENIHFLEFYLCPWAEFQTEAASYKCKISTSMKANHSYLIESSSGIAIWNARKVVDVKYKKGDRLAWSYSFLVMSDE